MAVTNVVINDIVEGDNYDIRRTITNIPSGQTLTQAWLTVKSSLADPDVNAIVQLSITTSLTSAGQITDDGADQTGALIFTLTGPQTRAIGDQSPTLLSFDIQLLTSTGKIYTLEIGTISALQDVTLSTS
jgi:hypothetical protein